MEMNQETLERMRQMRLLGMYNAFKASLEAFRTDRMTTTGSSHGWSATNGTTVVTVWLNG